MYKFNVMKNIFLIIVLLVTISSSHLYSQNDKGVNDESNNIYSVVDKKPYLEGFKRNTEKYFEQYLKYPSDAFLAKIEGLVYVSFVVTDTGSVGDVYVSQTSNNLFNHEAIRLVKHSSGHWKPGMVDGKVVNTRMVVPVKFKMSDSDHEAAEMLSAFDESVGTPLFILNKKIVSGVLEIEDYNVKSIRVIKGDKAIEQYGEKGKNGVVVITSKNGTNPIHKR